MKQPEMLDNGRRVHQTAAGTLESGASTCRSGEGVRMSKPDWKLRVSRRLRSTAPGPIRHIWHIRFCFSVAGLVPLVLLLHHSMQPVSAAGRETGFSAEAVVFWVLALIWFWAYLRCARIDRSIADRDVCWECLYPVDAVRPDTQRCPECGFPIAESEDLFKRWYAKRTWVRRLIG